MVQKGNILDLADNNQYCIVDAFNDNGTTYVYLVDINNDSNIIYGKLDKDEIVELNDPNELERVIKIVNDNLHNN